MILPTCKHCGQTLLFAEPLKNIGLTPQQDIIVEALRRAGKNGMSTDMVIEKMYGDCAGGGAETATNVLSVQKRLMRDKLKAAGYQIQMESRGRAPGIYRLMPL